MLDQLSTLFEVLRAQFISIPLNNALSIVYVIINAILLIFAPSFGEE